MEVRTPPERLDRAQSLIDRSQKADARRFFEQLRQSHEIYFKNARGLPDSNRQRARLIKQNIEYHAQHASPEVRQGRWLVKFGDWHLYRGFNPLQQLDLGNYFSEKADAERRESLHIIVLGGKGTRLIYAGPGRPYRVSSFELRQDGNYAFMTPFLDALLPTGCTLFDLRALRSGGAPLQNPNLLRLIHGYDLLVIIPDVTAASALR